MSLVELMVGIVVGLFIMVGATYFVVNFNGENRRLLLEARLTQDMRAAMDIVTRDLRRAGYWDNSPSGTNIFGSTPVVTTYDSTGYGVVAPTAASGPASSVSYAYAKGTANVVDPNTEQFSFGVSGGVLTTTLGASGAQPLTDANTTMVDDFTVTPTTAEEDVTCPTTCTVNCPKVYIRELAITFTAHAVVDPTVRRTLKNNIRLRNDRQTGACPT
jgi:prepilin peptidase dependent protein B